MSATTTSVFKTLSMADSCLLSLPSIFAAKSPSLSLSVPSRPFKLHLSSSFSPSLSLKKKTHFSSIVACVAQTEEENTITLEQEDGAEAVVSESEGEAEGGESSGEGSFEDASYPEPSEDAKIFVGNLPYDVDSEKLAMLFEQSGVVEISEVVYNRETDRSRGFGFVTMSTVEEAEKAVEKFNGYDMGGRILTVNKAARRGERVERPPRSFEPAFRIYVGNLPWNVDNSRLEQIFSEHGKVEDARVVYDRETGRSRGFGFVTMASENEMNDAIAALDGQNLEGRSVRVNVAEQRPRSF